ncbi:hypothetical protein WJX75_008523 [Coccomyxa subellipsoidea]|uniref:DEP domain-containing protein n=1 Tax=Coccomyxa subellipsoidea TaxID=248742 RepID=A0ABR2YLF2_9CHLO
MEPAPSSSCHAGTPTSESGELIAPRRSVSMPDGQNFRLWSDAELIALADRMQHGLDIRDRVHHFKKYLCCFSGADAVRWLIRSGNAGSDGEALLLGNDMMRAGLLHHVKYKRPFEKNSNLYRFMDAVSGASDITEDSQTDASSPSSHPDAQDFTRRGDGKRGQVAPLRGTQHEGWSIDAELARLQRKVAELAAELEEYKQFNSTMMDSITLQLKNEQQLFALLQHRLERAIRRGTWVALQLQVVWVEQSVQLRALSKDDLERLGQPPSEEDFDGWPDAPLLLRSAPLPYQQLEQSADPCAIRVNDSRRIEFETEVFRGCVVISAKGLSSSPDGLFAGERRKTSITIQGCFKADLAVEEVVTGQEFERRPKNLPAMWLVEKVLIRLAKKISPSMDIGPLSAPYLLAPVLAMAQLVNVSRPGEEPDPSQPIPEDMRLFDPALTDGNGGPMDALKRKKRFWDPKRRAGHSFTREHVWTFQMYQHFVDMGSYELNLMYTFDLARHLDGQPLQFMLKDRASGQYLFNFHSWHSKLLPAAHAARDNFSDKDSAAVPVTAED